jgi:hypothetical protein
MRNNLIILCILSALVMGYFTVSTRKELEDTETYVIILQDSLAIKDEEIDYLKTRERQLINEGGNVKQEYAEYKFRMEKSEPVVVTKPSKPNSNEKVIPVSVTASQHYIDILSKRYKNH